MARTLVLVAALFAVAACGVGAPPPVERVTSLAALSPSQLGAVHQKVRASLKDPDSARFGDTVAGILPDEGADDGRANSMFVCGLVNAKNSYGGYTGHKPYMGFLASAGELHTFLLVGLASAPREVDHYYRECGRRGLIL